MAQEAEVPRITVSDVSHVNRGIQLLPLEQLLDAPKAWNFYKALPEGKFYELIQSIQDNGILQPLIVWAREENAYTILSGHNRKNAARLLHEKTGEARFMRLPCVVYERDELTQEQARGIIVDCNWVQRTLMPTEKAKSIYHKYIELGRFRRGEGNGIRRYDQIANYFGLKATQVYQYYKIATLEEEWLSKLDEGKLSIKALVKLTMFSEEQRAVLAKAESLATKDILALDPSMDTETLTRRIGLDQQVPMRELRVWVPSNRYKEISERVHSILESKS